MRIKFKLPDLVIEKISQYLGNCRLYNGEIIQTIDKSSKEIVELQWKLESRIRHTYLTTYTSSEWKEISKQKEEGKRNITYLYSCLHDRTGERRNIPRLSIKVR